MLSDTLLLSAITELVALTLLSCSCSASTRNKSDLPKIYPLHVVTRLHSGHPYRKSHKLQLNRSLAVHQSRLFSTKYIASTTSPQTWQSSTRPVLNERNLQLNLKKNPLVVSELDDLYYKKVQKKYSDGKQRSDGNNVFAKLSSLVNSAADVAKMFQKFAALSQRNIRRRESTSRNTKAYDFGQYSGSRRRAPLLAYSQDDAVHKVQKDSSHAGNNALENMEWAELLLGPRGVLAAVFHILDDRRKITTKIGNRQTAGTATYHQSDLSLLPDFLLNAKPIDFGKIFEAFLTGKGDFDERISNLPEILGICNRLSCGDIYKAIDEFRKSEFFVNFQTALQLIQDPQGWDILGDLITNPELIAQFMGGNGGDLSNLFGGLKKKTTPGKASNKHGTEIGPDDGDLGVDFSKMTATKKDKKPSAELLPEIAENVDSENVDAVDYYNAVEGELVEGGEVEIVKKPDETVPLPTKGISTIASSTRRTLVSTTFATGLSRKPSIHTANKVPVAKVLPPDTMLPGIEIAESIDEVDHTNINVDVTIPSGWKKNERVLTYAPYPKATSMIPLTRQPYTVSQTKYPYHTTSQNRPPYRTVTQSKRLYHTVTHRPPIVHVTTATRSYSTRNTLPTRIILTTTTKKPTTRNFREESDYYAMYYDDH